MQVIFDVALSFAGEQRDYAKKIASALVGQGVRVFYDGFFEAQIWGKDLGDFLDSVYRKQSRFIVILVSRDYKAKRWTNHERKSAMAAAIESDVEMVLPIRFDDTELDGLRSSTVYLRASEKTPFQIATLIVGKLSERQDIEPSFIFGLPLWRLTQPRYSERAFSVAAARLMGSLGGRWNSIGKQAIYCASSLCLAVLETVYQPVHDDSLRPLQDMVAVQARFPTSVAIQHVTEANLPSSWRATPPVEATQRIGDAWLEARASCILSVPSKVLSGDRNFLLNPLHPDFESLAVISEQRISF
jgi:RES domain-containing protein